MDNILNYLNNSINPTFNPEIAVRAFEILSGGKTLHSVQHELGITDGVHFEWMKLHPLYKTAIQCGHKAAMEVWIQKGADNLAKVTFKERVYKELLRQMDTIASENDKVTPNHVFAFKIERIPPKEEIDKLYRKNHPEEFLEDKLPSNESSIEPE